MRLIHEIQAGRKVRSPPGALTWELFGSPIPAFQAYVTCDEVAAWIASHDNSKWFDFHTDIGPMIPPFDSMWIEHRYHQGARGYVVQTEKKDDGARRVWVTSLKWERGDQIRLLPAGVSIDIDSDGQLMPDATLGDGTHSTSGVNIYLPPGTDPAEAPYVMSTVSLAPMFAISFMNVVNSRRDDEPQHRGTVKAFKRKGVVPLAMNRIRLPVARSSSRSDIKAATGGVMPLHLVRGHFKTYTVDAPLFGKSTGTYWWGWQSRGKAERGVRGHTYEVGTR